MQAKSSPAAAQVHIHLAERSYPIAIGVNLLGNASTYEQLPQATTALGITVNSALELVTEP